MARRRLPLLAVRAPRENRLGDLLGLRIDVARHELAIVGERFGHAQRRVPGEHPDLEDALRADHSHDHAEERALDASDLHLRPLHLFVRDDAKLVEERRHGIGVSGGVIFDGLGNECEHGAGAYADRERWSC